MNTTGGQASGPPLAWKNDVALEIWVDDSGPAIEIRLSGTLDCDTATNLASLVVELIDQGGRRFILETHALRVTDAEGHAALAEMCRLIRVSGGSLSWPGSTRSEDITILRGLQPFVPASTFQSVDRD